MSYDTFCDFLIEFARRFRIADGETREIVQRQISYFADPEFDIDDINLIVGTIGGALFLEEDACDL